MSEKITVIAKMDAGNHAVHGQIKKGEKYTINPDHFAAELFERPEGFKSRLEILDDERRATKQPAAEPAAEPAAPKTSKKSTAPETPAP